MMSSIERLSMISREESWIGQIGYCVPPPPPARIISEIPYAERKKRVENECEVVIQVEKGLLVFV